MRGSWFSSIPLGIYRYYRLEPYILDLPNVPFKQSWGMCRRSLLIWVSRRSMSPPRFFEAFRRTHIPNLEIFSLRFSISRTSIHPCAYRRTHHTNQPAVALPLH